MKDAIIGGLAFAFMLIGATIIGFVATPWRWSSNRQFNRQYDKDLAAGLIRPPSKKNYQPLRLVKGG